MAKIITVKTGNYKEKLPDREMEMSLDPNEMERFLTAFPEFDKIKSPIDTGWETATIEVTMKIKAFKKKLDGSEEKK